MNNKIFLLLGTNLGDRKVNLDLAISEIEKLVGEVREKSSVYLTAAWGKLDQPEFYNQVVAVETKLDAFQILKSILEIETKLGRERKVMWGERLIDIDILMIGDLMIQTKTLTVPHPQLANRRFTLVPLAEIASKSVHPILQKSVEALLIECKDSLAVNLVN